MENYQVLWKWGEITPVHKKDCTLHKANYRPLTILPTLSKVFEIIIHSRISPSLKKFITDMYHSCETALLSLTEKWRKDLDNHKTVGIISMDLSKAFDSIPHDLLICRLKEYGVDERAIKLLKDYLTNRTQRVKLGCICSTWQLITKGIPQGSILGPVLFNIFMNDLWHSVKHSTLCIYMYADDTQISFADKDPTKVEEAINSDLMSIDRWYEENSMKRNPDKYQAMLLGKATANGLNFKCDNTTLPLSSEIELLGETVDNKLKFENHTRSICTL